MLRIAISCGEGFSSGFLAKHLQEEIKKEGLGEEYSIERIPFFQLEQRQDDVDIAMIMPHIEWKIKDAKADWKIPLYVIPYKVMLKPSLYDYLEDAKDILELANGKTGRVCFPGECRTNKVQRLESYRKWHKEHPEAE